MKLLGKGGIWGLFIPEASVGDMYKFLIRAKNGRKLYKADPFANQAELRPGTASIVADLRGFEWTDSKWMKETIIIPITQMMTKKIFIRSLWQFMNVI